ncbi:uncharacterized protein LOC127866659 isoform X2 [Dreissena polymorpha]|uniref:uncharacterized protein LOC127866659 isoform X2 n=1 Tax=Dreissena polymorpha TaxID=45954 RepID=UPI00226550E9|nr:uncharacterized protein LOC127866659 isoform X2 [Dreissena polymorpha]
MEERLSKKEAQNWLKCMFAAYTTRDAIAQLADIGFKAFYTHIRSVMHAKYGILETKTCSSCCTPSKQCSLCSEIGYQIWDNHRFKKANLKGPSWNNTDTTQWYTESWELAKCYMPPSGYRDKPNADSTDFNGIIGAIYNCIWMQCYFMDDLSKDSNICTKAREEVKELRHLQDIEICDGDMISFFDCLLNLLNDPAHLFSFKPAADARTYLKQLQQDTLALSEKAVKRTLKNIYEDRKEAFLVDKTNIWKKTKKEESIKEAEPFNQVQTTEGNTSSHELHDMSTVYQMSSDVSETRTTGPSTSSTISLDVKKGEAQKDRLRKNGLRIEVLGSYNDTSKQMHFNVLLVMKNTATDEYWTSFIDDRFKCNKDGFETSCECCVVYEPEFQFPNWVRPSWGEITFMFPQPDGTLRMEIMMSTDDVHKVQFLFSNRNISTAFQLEMRNYCSTIKGNTGCFTVEMFSNSIRPEEFMNRIKTRCESIITFYVVNSEENKCVFQNILKMEPDKLNERTMILHHNEILVCVADGTAFLNETLKDVGYTDVETVDINSLQENIKDLGIEKNCINLHPHLKGVYVDLVKQTCTFSWYGRRHEKGMDLIKRFLNRFERTEFISHDFDWTKFASNLIFQNTGNTNTEFLKYITSKYLKNKSEVEIPSFCLVKNDEGNIVLVQTGSAKELSNLIQSSLHIHKISRECFESDQLRQRLLKDKNKIWFDKHQGVIVCFDFLSKDIMSCFVPKPNKISRNITGDELRMLPSYIQTFSKDLASKCKTFEVDLIIHNETVVLEGTDSTQIDKCLNLIIGQYSSRRMLVVVEDNTFEHCKAELQRVQNSKSCRFKCLSMNKIKTNLTGFAAEYQDLYGTTHFRLLEDGSKIRTDILLELSNEHELPLSNKDSAKRYRCFATDELDVKCLMGDVLRVLHKSSINERLQCIEIWSIVCTQSKGNITYVISSDQLIKAFSVVLGCALQKNFINICLRMSLNGNIHAWLPETLIVNSLVQAFCKQSKADNSVQMTVEIPLPKDVIVETAYALEEALMKMHGAFVKIPRMHYSEEGAIDVVIKVSSIQKEMADVIVCAQSQSLDFQGQCAKEIAHAAGDAIVAECMEHFPNGIEYCDVAYTSAHRLKSNGVKYIFHTALPAFNEAYMQNIRQVVRNCLITAEELGCETIAFPAFGVGNREYPWRETAFQMFESIYDYGKQNPSTILKKITVVTFEGDQATCRAFEYENYRRRTICPKIQPDSTKHGDIIQRTIGNVSIRVVEEKNAMRPAYAVEAFFDSDGDGFKLKRAIWESKTQNDQIIVGLKKSLFYNFFDNIRDTITDERVTHLIWNLDKTSQMCYGDQVTTIVKMMEAICNKHDMNYLMVVDIIVPDESGFASFKSQADASKWTLISVKDKRECVVEVIAESKDALVRARNIVEEVLQHKRPTVCNNGTSTERSLPNVDPANETTMSPKHQVTLHTNTNVPPASVCPPAMNSEKETETEEAINIKGKISYLNTDPLVAGKSAGGHSVSESEKSDEIESYELSAVINPGMTAYLQDHLSKWITAMESIYKVKIYYKEPTHIVYGNMDNVIAFEQYLENNFPHIETTL